MEEPRLNLLIYNKNSASMKPLTKIIQPKVYISTLWSFNKETTSNPLTINESRFLQFLFIKNKNTKQDNK